MLRVTTIHARSSGASARYYTQYLEADESERPGYWTGRQAAGLGVSGSVDTASLEAVLSGHHPIAGDQLGSKLVDKYNRNGRAIRAVAGFDATFSAPKSVSTWWGLTRDPGLQEAHHLAVQVVLEHIEARATTRVRVNGPRMYPDVENGLTMAVFPQSTSREDDPHLHTHAVISTKVIGPNGRWYALDGHYVKNNQRALGGLYQSVLRAELTHRYGVRWGPIVDGQAEIADMPVEIMEAFSKRTRQVEAYEQILLVGFREREGRDPTRWEHAALKREAAADSPSAKTGAPVADLAMRWREEAAELGWTPRKLTQELTKPQRELPAPEHVTIAQVLDLLSAQQSTWERADVLRAVCDLTEVHPGIDGRAWARSVDRAVSAVIDTQQNLEPPCDEVFRRSDGRSVWTDPAKAHLTDARILEQEERILDFAIEAQADGPTRSDTVDRAGLDVLQADAAAAVAGSDRLVLVVGPAGTGKTTTLACATDDLRQWGRMVFGVAPTAKAARVLAAEMSMEADTVAKLLYEWNRETGPGERWRLGPGATVIVDETGMLGTPSLDRLVGLARSQDWRLVLVGDPSQLHAVGRGGMFDELCRVGRTHELAVIHRFTHDWEQLATRQLRAARSVALDAYLDHHRIDSGSLEDHLERIADAWIEHTAASRAVAVTAETNAHVDTLNEAIQARRRDRGEVDDRVTARMAGGESVGAGDVVVTRSNDRTRVTDEGEPVRNRERWRIDAVTHDGGVTVSRIGGHGSVTLPAEYAQSHVRLGYASTAYGVQGETADVSYTLVSRATTHRSLYVGATRGRDTNHLAVITETADLDDARDTLESVLANDRVDVPAIVRRRELAEKAPPPARPADQRDAAQSAFDEAMRRSAPARAVLDRAKIYLQSANAEVSDLEAELRSARPWHRRSMRRDLAAAKERTVVARSLNEDALDQARPFLDEVAQTQRQLDEAQTEADIDLMRQRFDTFAREAPSRGGLSR
ncbi:MAG: relaxase domain-containing protein [Hyphomicrobiales bacterium]|nr:relaxase domain-containing protein [Hyphomicrobiales bacterium]